MYFDTFKTSTKRLTSQIDSHVSIPDPLLRRNAVNRPRRRFECRSRVRAEVTWAKKSGFSAERQLVAVEADLSVTRRGLKTIEDGQYLATVSSSVTRNCDRTEMKVADTEALFKVRNRSKVVECGYFESD